MKGKTAFQKIINSHLVRILPDGTMVLKINKVFCHEITTPPHIIGAKELDIDVVWNPNRVFAMIDHVSPAKDSKTARQGFIMRQWSKEHNLAFFDVGQNGICHAFIPERGLILPGEIAIMGDSHTCTYGALCAFSVGVGTTDLGCGLMTGIILVRPQKVIHINFVGTLPPNVYAKDLALMVVKYFGKGGGKNAVLEFGGDVIKSMAGRFTISNMVVEGGATCGMWMVDKVTVDYLWPLLKEKYTDKESALSDLSNRNSDPGCEYVETIDIDVTHLKPVTTINYHPSEVVEVASLTGKEIDQVVIGSCTNARIEDLRTVAAIFRKIGKPTKVRTIVIPATSHIYEMAIKEGLISTFLAAGCCVTNPTCGPCLGMSCGVLWEGEVCVSTTNRNYLDRMGKGGMVHLASPAVAAYAAMFGEIVEPEIGLCTEVNASVTVSDQVVPFRQKPKSVPKIIYGKLHDSLLSLGTAKVFSGRPFCLNRDKVNTDEIIPAAYLTEVDKKSFGEHCLEEVVKDPQAREQLLRSQIIISGSRFGDGSSREQAPWALEGVGIVCVIAKSFERIFETNYFNNGNLPITLPPEIVDELLETSPEHIGVVWNTEEGKPGYIRWQEGRSAEFQISELQKSIIRKGGSVGIILELATELQAEGKI